LRRWRSFRYFTGVGKIR